MKDKLMIIPNKNNLLEKELKDNINDYMNQVFSCFLKLLEKPKTIPDSMKIFQFEGTDLQVIIKRENYIANLDNLMEYYIKMEEYEKCQKLTKILDILNKEE